MNFRSAVLRRSLRRVLNFVKLYNNYNLQFEELRWRRLDRQVQRNLPRFRKAWDEQTRRVQKLPEWRRFKWLSMREGKVGIAFYQIATGTPVVYTPTATFLYLICLILYLNVIIKDKVQDKENAIIKNGI